MDDIQLKVVDAIHTHKDLVNDRVKFKGMLADYLIDDKIHLNVLMNAYDEKFPIKIKNAADKTLVAIRYIKILSENYGITGEYARWSIVTWCAVLGYNDVADAIMSVSVQNNSDKKTIKSLDEEYEIGLGIYCAGIDFPAGEISISVKWSYSKAVILYGVGSDVDHLIARRTFVDRTYLTVNEGEYILLMIDKDDYPDAEQDWVEEIIVRPTYKVV